jgi:nucleotide-binding universal stress UspA family protein
VFRKILLPVDMTDRHAQALSVAAEMAGRAGEVVVLHVIEVIAGLTMDEEKPFYTRLERAARAHLEKLGADLSGRKVQTRAEIRFGNRVAEIAKYAGEGPADLIILTAPRFVPSDPAASLGSTSYRVGLFAPCPVLLVK